MIEELLPPTVVGIDTTGDPASISLYPAELAVVSRAVAERRREFATARWCARRALAAIGVPVAPIVPGPRGAPSWPAGVVGSLTHCLGYRAAAVARRTDVLGVGIDAEPDEPLPAGVLRLVSTPPERAALARSTVDGVCADRLLFSAKEAVYKAWFPLTGRWLDFPEVEMAFAAGSFRAVLRVPGVVVDGRELAGFAGTWLARDGLIVTAVVEPAGRVRCLPSREDGTATG